MPIYLLNFGGMFTPVLGLNDIFHQTVFRDHFARYYFYAKNVELWYDFCEAGTISCSRINLIQSGDPKKCFEQAEKPEQFLTKLSHVPAIFCKILSPVDRSVTTPRRCSWPSSPSTTPRPTASPSSSPTGTSPAASRASPGGTPPATPGRKHHHQSCPRPRHNHSQSLFPKLKT